MHHQTIAVLDYGSQYSQLICRRVREKQVYAELIPWDRAADLLPTLQPAGIILSGGPSSVHVNGAPYRSVKELQEIAPVLGICYGMQLVAVDQGPLAADQGQAIGLGIHLQESCLHLGPHHRIADRDGDG